MFLTFDTDSFNGNLTVVLLIHILYQSLKVKGPHIYKLQITGKPEQQRFTIQMVSWPALTVASAAHLAAAHSQTLIATDTLTIG